MSRCRGNYSYNKTGSFAVGSHSDGFRQENEAGECVELGIVEATGRVLDWGDDLNQENRSCARLSSLVAMGRGNGRARRSRFLWANNNGLGENWQVHNCFR